MNNLAVVRYQAWKSQISCTSDVRFPTNGEACNERTTIFERDLHYGSLKFSGGKEARVFFANCRHCGKIIVIPPERIPDGVQLYVMTIARTSEYVKQDTHGRLAMLNDELQELTRGITRIKNEIAFVKSQCTHDRTESDDRAVTVCLDCGKHFT